MMLSTLETGKQASTSPRCENLPQSSVSGKIMEETKNYCEINSFIVSYQYIFNFHSYFIYPTVHILVNIS